MVSLTGYQVNGIGSPPFQIHFDRCDGQQRRTLYRSCPKELSVQVVFHNDGPSFNTQRDGDDGKAAKKSITHCRVPDWAKKRFESGLISPPLM
jgi:hypothetical protein